MILQHWWPLIATLGLSGGTMLIGIGAALLEDRLAQQGHTLYAKLRGWGDRVALGILIGAAGLAIYVLVIMPHPPETICMPTATEWSCNVLHFEMMLRIAMGLALFPPLLTIGAAWLLIQKAIRSAHERPAPSTEMAISPAASSEMAVLPEP